MQKNIVIIIGGATASGKTTLSIELAKHFGAEILSADSRLFYKGMDIGTAKPSLEERQGIPHHFIDICAPCQPYTVGDYEREALALLEKIFKKNRLAIVVGGSGLFIRALTDGLDRFPDVSEAIKVEVEALFDKGGIEAYQTLLSKLDPEYYKSVDTNNPARMRRALEVCLQSAAPYSSFLGQKKSKRIFEPCHVLLDVPRTILYGRINGRVETMVELGLEAEARRFYALKDCPSSKTVGYSEWFKHFDGLWTRSEAIDKIKQHSRNYAKRQGTWFRKHGDWKSFESHETKPVLTYLKEELKIF